MTVKDKKMDYALACDIGMNNYKLIQRKFRDLYLGYARDYRKIIHTHVHEDYMMETIDSLYEMCERIHPEREDFIIEKNQKCITSAAKLFDTTDDLRRTVKRVVRYYKKLCDVELAKTAEGARDHQYRFKCIMQDYDQLMKRMNNDYNFYKIKHDNLMDYYKLSLIHI